MRLNVAVGGNYLTAPYNDANNGIDQLPATMEVDWVRVYEKEANCTALSLCEKIDNGRVEEGVNAWILRSFQGATGSIVGNNGILKIDVLFLCYFTNNIVLGIGSYSYQYNTRDTFGFAMKATSVVVQGERREIFKTSSSQLGRGFFLHKMYRSNGRFRNNNAKSKMLQKE